MYTSYVPENLTLNALESYTYSCIDGYATDDNLCTVCLSNGALSSPPPNCTGKWKWLNFSVMFKMLGGAID